MVRSKKPFEMTIGEACSAIGRGELTPSELLESCLERIDAVEDKVKAWVYLDREGAVKAAEQLDREASIGKIRGLLHGIPVGIKDIIYVKGLPNECGSKSCAGYMPAFDATVVTKLRKAGAIILGKTHTTEYAYFDPAPTRNPWNTDHTPGGSSSGSAAGVAARMFPAALGSQTLGSILRPAVYNGIVGLKGEHGRVSAYGVMPVSWNLDHIGVLARTVEDAAIVFQVIAGYDSRDLYSLNEEVPDFLSRLESKRAPRIGLMREYFYERADDDERRTTDNAAKRLDEAGAKVEEVKPPASLSAAHPAGDIIIAVEAAAVHEEKFAKLKDKYGPGIRALVEKGMGIKASDFARALDAQRQQRADALSLFDKYDVILTPGTPSAAPQGMPTGKPLMQAPWTVMRLPTIALPTELNKQGLPLGIQLTGGPKSENKLLAVARWCEKALEAKLGMPMG